MKWLILDFGFIYNDAKRSVDNTLNALWCVNWSHYYVHKIYHALSESFATLVINEHKVRYVHGK